MNTQDTSSRPLAVITGASSGIGRELALECARHGYDLLLAADRSQEDTAAACRLEGAQVQTLHADLATSAGVDALIAEVSGRPVAALLANAGHGLGHAFLDQDFNAVRHVIDTNVTGTLDVIQRVGRSMRERNAGKILITGSIAGLMPGAFQAVYNGTKAFIDSFAYALRNELKDTDVSVTVLMPGPTDTEFFRRAELTDTKVGSGKKQPPEEVAKAGYEAMEDGESSVVAGWKNKLQALLANVTPAEVLAEQHRKTAEPGSGSGDDGNSATSSAQELSGQARREGNDRGLRDPAPQGEGSGEGGGRGGNFFGMYGGPAGRPDSDAPPRGGDALPSPDQAVAGPGPQR